MSPKPVQKKSIKDHFAIIPKKPKVEPKLYPLFVKKKKDPVKKENIAPKPINIPIKTCNDSPPVHRIKKQVNQQVNPFNDLII
jgi:hypothetical protein